MAWVMPVLMATGTVMSAGSQIASGRAQDQQARIEARQLDRNAKAAFAEGTRASYEYRRQGRIMQSNQRAQMAGSGGVTDDPAAIETLGETGRDAAYNALAAMYSYRTKGIGLQEQAGARRLEGSNARRASRWRGLSTVISGAYEYGDKFGFA